MDSSSNQLSVDNLQGPIRKRRSSEAFGHGHPSEGEKKKPDQRGARLGSWDTSSPDRQAQLGADETNTPAPRHSHHPSCDAHAQCRYQPVSAATTSFSPYTWTPSDHSDDMRNAEDSDLSSQDESSFPTTADLASLNYPEPDHDGHDDHDVDSAYAASPSSSTSSLASYDAQTEDGQYFGHLGKPMFFYTESDRKMQEYMVCLWRFIEGRHYHAPIVNPKHIVDLGAGTGEWARLVADEDSAVEVVGIDRRREFNPVGPSNCKFRVDDIELQWEWSGPCTLISIFMLSWELSKWKHVVQEAYEKIYVGGWLERRDLCVPFLSNCSALVQSWMESFYEGCRFAGVELQTADDFAGMLREAHFEQVYKDGRKWPLAHNCEFGDLLLGIVKGLVESSLPIFKKYRGYDERHAQSLLADVCRSIEADRDTITFNVFIVYGLKT